MNELAADVLEIAPALIRWAVHGRAAEAGEAQAALADGAPLLLMMHGYGSFEGDLIELARALPPGFVCASPRAPLTAPPPVVGGYAWFPIAFAADGTVEESNGMNPGPAFVDSDPHAAALALLSWLDTLDSRGGVALLGFSQGGAMITSLLRLRPDAFACAVICSGFVPAGSFPGDRDLATVRPPAFWGYDPADQVIGHDRITGLADWLPTHTTLEQRAYPGIAHSISNEELSDISAFLLRHVPHSQREGVGR